jgi:hypothetical protein
MMAFGNNLGAAMRQSGVEHRRTIEIRTILADTTNKAQSAKMRAIRRGAAISLAERERRALARAHAPAPAPQVPAYAPVHIENGSPREALADAVVASLGLR